MAPELMSTEERSNLLTALQKGEVSVVFKKINTEEIRVMPCTLNPVVLEAHSVKGGINKTDPESDHFAVWALDKEAWRSFRVNTVVSWEVLG